VTPRPAPAAILSGLAAVCVLAVGCGPPGAGSRGEGQPQLAGTVQQYREDEVQGLLQVSLTNRGPSAVVIERIELAWPGFAESPRAEPDYRLGPGITADLPLALAPADCSASDDPQDQGPTAPAVAHIRLAGGASVEVPLPDSPALGRAFTADCRRQHIASEVQLAFGPDWVRGGQGADSVLTGSLELTRRDAVGEVAVVSVDGSVLLALALEGDPGPVGARLPPDEDTARFPVVARSTLRCDGHSLGESKKTFVFDVAVNLGDGEDRPYALTPDATGRALMQTLIEDACGR